MVGLGNIVPKVRRKLLEVANKTSTAAQELLTFDFLVIFAVSGLIALYRLNFRWQHPAAL
jgi:hypothetical protein